MNDVPERNAGPGAKGESRGSGAPDWIALARRARDNEPGAINELLAALRPLIRGLAHSQLIREGLQERVSARFDASDVTQETLMAVSLRISAFLGTTEPEFVAWVKSILRHDILDSIREHINNQGRSINKEVRMDDSAVGGPAWSSRIASRQSSPSSAAIQRENEGHLEAAIETLEELDREIVRRWLTKQVTQAEIAAELGLTPAAVAKRLERAKKRLHAYLDSSREDHHG